MIRMAINKSELAGELGISRSSLYYQPKRQAIDEEVRRQIESVLADHPAYGHKRIAMSLKLNKKRILRVMKKFNIAPYRRRAKKRLKKGDLNKPPAGYANLIEGKKASGPNEIWCTDFTYIKYKTRFIYLATIIDLFTREIVGANVSRFHNRFLVIGALEDALKRYHHPKIIHSDQGSEYDSSDFTFFAESAGIKVSMSKKGSPWQNGHQESFFGHLKNESGDLDRFETIGELLEELYRLIYYYNNKRIHTALKMTPVEYRNNYINKDIKSES